MALHITPQLVAATYELLRMTLPFRRWKLPHADDVEFHITEHSDIDGDCLVSGGKVRIRVTADRNNTLGKLLLTLGHEMCHVRQEVVAPEDVHGEPFMHLARLVCRRHGFRMEDFL